MSKQVIKSIIANQQRRVHCNRYRFFPSSVGELGSAIEQWDDDTDTILGNSGGGMVSVKLCVQFATLEQRNVTVKRRSAMNQIGMGRTRG